MNLEWLFYAVAWEVIGVFAWGWANFIAHLDNPTSDRNSKKWMMLSIAPFLGPVLLLSVAIIAPTSNGAKRGLRFK